MRFYRFLVFLLGGCFLSSGAYAFDDVEQGVRIKISPSGDSYRVKICEAGSCVPAKGDIVGSEFLQFGKFELRDITGDSVRELVVTSSGVVNSCSEYYQIDAKNRTLKAIRTEEGSFVPCNVRYERGHLISSFRDGPRWIEELYKVADEPLLVYSDSCVGCGEIVRRFPDGKSVVVSDERDIFQRHQLPGPGGSLVQDCRACQVAGPKDQVFQTTVVDGGLVCIVVAPGSAYATIFLWGKSGDVFGRLEENSMLVTAEEALANRAFPSFQYSDGILKLVFSFPRNVYWVDFSLEKSGLKVSAVGETFRLGMAEPDMVEKSIGLVRRYRGSEAKSLSNLSRGDVFENRELKLELADVGTSVMISASKAMIYSEPRAGAENGMYLVRGDSVKALEHVRGWLFFSFVTARGREIRHWVKVEDLL